MGQKWAMEMHIERPPTASAQMWQQCMMRSASTQCNNAQWGAKEGGLSGASYTHGAHGRSARRP